MKNIVYEIVKNENHFYHFRIINKMFISFEV